MSESKKIGIVGSGLIGCSWAMIFASSGFEVKLYDVESDQVSTALTDIGKQLEALSESGMLRGSLTASQQFKLISGVTSLEDCVSGACHVQECIPEQLDFKIKIFQELDKLVGNDTVLSSSTSCIVPSKFTENLVHRSNCLVSHPINPPYYTPVVEIIPAPWTNPGVVQRTKMLLQKVGQVPIAFTKEIPGFGINRIQYAILNECWNLVNDGILTAEDVDKLMTDGLALRYAWMGPFETVHMNAEGTQNYVERYGSNLRAVSETFKPTPPWTPESCEFLTREMNAKIPLDKLKERRAWRDERLMALAKLKKVMKDKE